MATIEERKQQLENKLKKMAEDNVVVKPVTIPNSFDPSEDTEEGVSKCTHPLFYAQSPDFLKPGLCYFLKFLYL